MVQDTPYNFLPVDMDIIELLQNEWHRLTVDIVSFHITHKSKKFVNLFRGMS